MKKISKLLAAVLTLSMLFAFSTVAFAAGETLYHYGTSTVGYYTTQSVPQKSDNHLRCINCAATASGMMAYAVEDTSSGYTTVSKSVGLGIYAEIYIPDNSYVRDIHLRIQNTGYSAGQSRYTEATWQLFV